MDSSKRLPRCTCRISSWVMARFVHQTRSRYARTDSAPFPKSEFSKRQPVGDHLARNRFVYLRHDRLNSDLGISDVALIRQRALLLHRGGKGLDHGPRIDAAIGIREESAHFLLQ